MDSIQLGKLLSIIQETGSFNKLLQKFHAETSVEPTLLKNHLCLLLIDEALQNHEILNALVILLECDANYDVFKSPYLSTILSISETLHHSIIMAFLIYISQKKKDRTWLDISSLDFFQEISRLPITPQDLEYLRKANNIYQTEISTLFPPEQFSPRKGWTESDLTEELQTLSAIQNESAFSKLKLELVTLVPPILEIEDDELENLDFEDEEEPLWTPIKRFFTISDHRYIELRQKAITAPLSPADSHEYLYALKQTPTFISKYPFSVEQTSQLLAHNWSLIIEIILLLHSVAQSEIGSNGASTNNHHSDHKPSAEPSLLLIFISAFLQMEITTQALETLHAVCKKVDLPLEFVQKYLLQCMEFCSKNKEIRYIRLVCGLIQSILKKNPKTISTVIVELQSFCLSFTNVKDAIVLYAMAKGIDNK